MPGTIIRNHMRKAIYLSLLLPLTVFAQQSLDESIAVEGRYAAEVIRMERLASFPRPFPVELPGMQLDYDLNPLNSPFRPSFYPLPLPPIADRGDRGYVDFSMGSWLDTRLDAGVWILTPNEKSPWRLGAWLGHDGTSLWRWKSDGAESSRRKDYDQNIGLTVARKLSNGQEISATVDYRLHYFNYFTTPSDPSQTINSFDADVNWTSASGASLMHRLGVAYNHFSYRSSPLFSHAEGAGPSRQDVVSVTGFIGNMDGDKPAKSNGKLSAASGGMSLAGDLNGVFGNNGSYGLLTLTPAYHAEWRGLRLKAGVNVDFSLKAGDAAEPFSAIHLSPDLAAIYPTDNFTIFLKAQGGSELQTLKVRDEISQWADPHQYSHCPLFSPIDATFGFNAGPSSEVLKGLYGGLSLRWKAVDHLPIYGWYPLALRLGSPVGQEMAAEQSALTSLHGLAVEANIGWSYRRIVDVDVTAAYTPQHGSRGFFNGADRPRWVVEGHLKVCPVSKLTLTVGADWRGVRRLWGEGDLYGMRIPDWFSMRFEARWQLLRQLEIGAGLYNLTDRRNFILPALPAEGLTAAGLVSFRF